jgi:NADH dehydrogenase
MQKRHHFVIVGGGAGGLELAAKLGNKLGKKNKARITLVDASLTHVWKPLLHEVAAGSLNYESSQVNYRAHAQRHHYEFQWGKLCKLRRDKKEIILAPSYDEKGELLLPERTVSYDSLVLAVGSSVNDFDTPGAQAHCLFLDSLEQAKSFQSQMLNTLLRKQFQKDEAVKTVHIAIVGAGATGVELAAELRHASQQMAVYGLHKINESQVKISLIEAADRALPALPERISAAAIQQLDAMNIKVRVSSSVKEVKEEGFVLVGDEFFQADLKVWAAGVKAPAFLDDLDGLATNHINQLKVTSTLQTTIDDSIFALGDCAECLQQDGKSAVPPRAQAAHQQAAVLFKTLTGLLKGHAPVAFVYKDHGSLISFSQDAAIGTLMGNLFGKSRFIEGRIARLVYISLYRMHQMAIHGLFRTGLIWLNDRILKVVHPKIKLH